MKDLLRRFDEWRKKVERERREYEEARIHRQTELIVRGLVAACAGAIAAYEAFNREANGGDEKVLRDAGISPSGAAR